MTSRRKIFQVLKQIKQESEINSDPGWVNFYFNDNLIGRDILSSDEEGRILIKLQNEGVLEFHLPDWEDGFFEEINQYTPEEFMMRSKFILIKILPSFRRKYFWFQFSFKNGNIWTVTNPFWIIWNLIKSFFSFIKWLLKRHKIIASICGILSVLFIFDWSLAWKNLKAVLSFLKIF